MVVVRGAGGRASRPHVAGARGCALQVGQPGPCRALQALQACAPLPCSPPSSTLVRARPTLLACLLFPATPEQGCRQSSGALPLACCLMVWATALCVRMDVILPDGSAHRLPPPHPFPTQPPQQCPSNQPTNQPNSRPHQRVHVAEVAHPAVAVLRPEAAAGRKRGLQVGQQRRRQRPVHRLDVRRVPPGRSPSGGAAAAAAAAFASPVRRGGAGHGHGIVATAAAAATVSGRDHGCGVLALVPSLPLALALFRGSRSRSRAVGRGGRGGGPSSEEGEEGVQRVAQHLAGRQAGRVRTRRGAGG